LRKLGFTVQLTIFSALYIKNIFLGRGMCSVIKNYLLGGLESLCLSIRRASTHPCGWSCFPISAWSVRGINVKENI